MMTAVGIDQIVNFPYSLGQHIGLIPLNTPSLVNRCEPVSGLSDHETVFIESDARKQPEISQ